MSAVSGGGNYISDGALLAWATQQQNRLYGDLQDTMHQQELQGQMASDLADIKQHLSALNGHPEETQNVHAELQAFVATYGANPQFDEITASVKEIDKTVAAQLPPEPVTPSTPLATVYTILNSASSAGSGHVAATHVDPIKPPLAEAQLKEWTDTLDKKLGAAGTNEQLGMIHINEIKSTIDQGTQVTSQMIKSSNDSMSSVIHNIA